MIRQPSSYERAKKVLEDKPWLSRKEVAHEVGVTTNSFAAILWRHEDNFTNMKTQAIKKMHNEYQWLLKLQVN